MKNLPMSLETSREYKGNIYVKNIRKNSCRIRNRIRVRIHNTVRIRMNLPMSLETSREYKGNIHVKNIRKNSWRIPNRIRIQGNTTVIRMKPTHEPGDETGIQR
jgi:hypothetical protein